MTSSSDARPAFEGLPDLPAIRELQERPQWVAWTWRIVEGRDKPTKPPINPHTGLGASHSNPATWGTYAEAEARAFHNNLPGVGYVITEDDEYTASDLDDCRNPVSGEFDAWAAAIVLLAETYTEVSPSGTGLRILWRGKVAATAKADPVHVEIYRSLRYLTITGQHVAGTPTSIRPAPRTEAALMERVAAFRAEQEQAREEAAAPVGGAPIHAIPRGTGGDFFRQVNTAALAALGSWVPSLFGPAAKFQKGTGAYRVSSQTLARGLEEDLSLAPNGIVDWGVHDMGDSRQGKRTPIDIVLEFAGGGICTAKAAAFWLCDRMGKPPDAFGWSVPGQGDWQEVDPALGAAIAAALIAAKAAKLLEKASSELEWFDDVKPIIDAPYVIKYLIDRGSMSVVYGPSNSGKTFFVVDLSFHVSIDSDWRARRVAGGGVLYLAAEGGNGIINRIVALRQTTGVVDVPFAVRRAGLDLLNPNADTKYVIALAKEVEQKTGKKLSLIVIDTLSRVIAGGDENAAVDMTAFIRNVDIIREATGAHVMVVHHTGKDLAKGARGHSSLRAATDTEIELFVDDFGNRIAKVTKQRDYSGGEEFAFSLIPVQLGIDADGDIVSTCVVEHLDKPDAVENQEPPIEICRAMLAVIADAWTNKNPLSIAAQTMHTGRYAPRLLGRKFKLKQSAVRGLIEKWLDTQIIMTSTVNSDSKMRGLKVLKML